MSEDKVSAKAGELAEKGSVGGTNISHTEMIEKIMAREKVLAQIMAQMQHLQNLMQQEPQDLQQQQPQNLQQQQEFVPKLRRGRGRGGGASRRRFYAKRQNDRSADKNKGHSVIYQYY
ncbi:hypothetical protein PV328_011974 [Microctonus aethiopoides]|uniref:Uncharacterized protein n=1 Tax=Microctonus aethiopoides TaxID=144406 RepID=A0AA39C347_9HYME|nr:hypothetical protein PV328_011974 [Microctonus aethiopoides]